MWVEREDYMEEAPKKYFRLTPGADVRLKHAYIIKCESAVYDESGKLVEILASYYPDTKSGSDESGIKAKGTIHWVSQNEGVACEVRMYDRLFTVPNPSDFEDEGKTIFDFYNKHSLITNHEAIMEPYLANASAGDHFQFLRKGYFVVDEDSSDEKKIFNLTVSLKEGW